MPPKQTKKALAESDANITTRDGIEEIDLSKVDHAIRQHLLHC